MLKNAESRSKKPVRLAFLQFLQPDLLHVLEELATVGVKRLTIFPLFIAGGGHVDQDIPEIAAQFRTTHPNVEVEILPALGENAEMQTLVGAISASILED